MASSEPNTLAWSFEWDRGRGEVAALGGMLGPVWFRLSDGRDVQPFAVAPWADEPDTPNDLPGVLQRLRGEWPCVPFGMPSAPEGLPSEWHANDQRVSAFHTDPHGVSSNQNWSLLRHLETGIEIAMDYPEGHPVKRLVRRIEGRPGAAAVDLELSIEVREDTLLPIGLHPVMALPAVTGAARLALPGAQTAYVYPVETEPGVSRLVPGATATDLSDLPTKDGTPLDLTRLPLVGHTEELVQVAVTDGTAYLANSDDDYTACLTWDAKQLPFCLLWVSNGGRSQPPWNGRHFALGMEPVAAAFDLGVDVSRSPNPLNSHGNTAVHLSKSSPFRTRYAIALEAGGTSVP